jgi:hypothetical protein
MVTVVLAMLVAQAEAATMVKGRVEGDTGMTIAGVPKRGVGTVTARLRTGGARPPARRPARRRA